MRRSAPPKKGVKNRERDHSAQAGELVLKGLNRRTFEDKLIANARRRLKHHGKFRVYTKQSTMYVEPKNDDCDMDGAWWP